MNIREEILYEHSKSQTEKVATYIGNDPKKFAELMELFFDQTYRVTQRAAWVVGVMGQKNPELVLPYLPRMIAYMKKDVHDAVIRNAVRVMQFIEIPEESMGEVADLCFDYLQDPKVPVAIRVFSMTVLHNITKKYPELGQELQLIIEAHLPDGSAGFKSRGKKILKALKK